tara:strand:+ start:195 stop:884 length:690 start_codon:yes stop_codon:yes gene_type:complete
MKNCTKCKVKKELNNFSKDKQKKDYLNSSCKSCEKEYYKANKERLKQYREANKERIEEYSKQYTKEYYKLNKGKVNERAKEYYKANKEKIKDKKKKYYKANKEKIIENANKYVMKRKKSFPLFKLKCNLRCRTWSAFKNKGYNKKTKTQEMLGVDWEVCKAHIERQFTKGMSWVNHGDWHIDHIIPLSSANTEEELKKLCHYSNLQPLWAVDNIVKSNVINGQQNKFRF